MVFRRSQPISAVKIYVGASRSSHSSDALQIRLRVESGFSSTGTTHPVSCRQMTVRRDAEMIHEGGCLCRALRYRTSGPPLRVTVCYCRFCQRATGSAYMVEPVSHRDDVLVACGDPAVFELTSEGSGKAVHVHFCPACGTKLYLTFQRFPETCSIYAGTFDDPDWFEIDPANAKHIFLDVARHDTLIPSGINAFPGHAITNEGVPNQPTVLDQPWAARDCLKVMSSPAAT